MKIANRTFIVSGGASGLGKACVEELVKNGANVSILDMNEDGQALASELGSSAKFFVCDVLDSASITKAVQGTVEWAQQTNKAIGGVIPAAGILDRNGSAFNLDDVDFVLGVNLRGTIDLVRQAVEEIAKADVDADGERGIVIMVASSAAFDGQKGQISYSASKGAVTAMTLPMARDLSRYSIRCVTIAPSLFETRMTSMMSGKVRKSLEATFEHPKRAGRPDEFAHLVNAVISNSMLNATVIRLDGGSRPSKI
ncbi:3-hydroxyacyl-CoA dehydrogenase type-2 [Tolypocladium paradoxum]|uniref:3-hydroxyacyl-CoA dehydrogenase type-2 n=1 Tax=Tolypocladium paradoxum TaxID=94208 RepID=A0A2S4KSK5_9HYPO|nr:3-hydroxyacyl-CoA dehydrogenase type-2 [Tolypocladium paradoxum]